MNQDDMKERVKSFWDCMNRGDLDSQLALLSEDAIFTVTGTTPVSGSHQGREAIRGHFTRFGSLVESGAQMLVRVLLAEGSIVVCLSEGVMKSVIGETYNNRYAFVFVFDGKEIASITEYLDTMLVETALFGRRLSG